MCYVLGVKQCFETMMVTFNVVFSDIWFSETFACCLFQISEDALDSEAEELEEESVVEGKDDEEEPSPPEPDG